MHLIMESREIIFLDVKTVPAFDTEIKMPHTAYTVSCLNESAGITVASGWTLRDAIHLFRQVYKIDEQTIIRLRRPFKQQR